MVVKTLDEYYLQNYSRCHVEDEFLSTWQGLAYPGHVIQSIAAPFQLLTFYVIVRKTPASMISAKWSLFVTHLLSTLVDFSICTLICPYIFFPSCAVFGVGVLSWLKIPILPQILAGLAVGFALAISIASLFENRSRVIPHNRFRMKRKGQRIVFYTLQYTLYCSFLLIATKVPVDQEAVKLKALESQPCPTKEYFTESPIILLSDPFWIKICCFVAAPVIVLNTFLHIIFHSICCTYYLYFITSTITSPHTRRLQKRFFVAIVVHVSVLLGTIAVPFLVMTHAMLTDNVTQKLINAMVNVVALHGISESVVLILVHRPYRQSVKMMICGCRKNKVSVGVSDREGTRSTSSTIRVARTNV